MNTLVMYSTHQPTAAHLDRLRAITTGGRVSVAAGEPEAMAAAHEAQIILGHRYLRQCLPYAKHLRWVQSTAGGVDRLPLTELAAMGVTLTRCTIASPVIARHALTLAWAITRRLDTARDRQRSGVWDNTFDWPPMPRRAAVFGMGAIGREIARLLDREEIEVVGVRNRVTDEAIPGVKTIVPAEAWREVLPQVDWCFLAMPHTPDTAGLFDEAALRLLPRHAVLVNVGRGESVVNQDLARVLNDGHLAGAALDVVAPKPIGPDDPFWRTPRLLITPHVAAHHDRRVADTEAYIEQQVARYVASRPLEDVVALKAEIT